VETRSTRIDSMANTARVALGATPDHAERRF
jgi:hypothetical protein